MEDRDRAMRRRHFKALGLRHARLNAKRFPCLFNRRSSGIISRSLLLKAHEDQQRTTPVHFCSFPLSIDLWSSQQREKHFCLHTWSLQLRHSLLVSSKFACILNTEWSWMLLPWWSYRLWAALNYQYLHIYGLTDIIIQWPFVLLLYVLEVLVSC